MPSHFYDKPQGMAACAARSHPFHGHPGAAGLTAPQDAHKPAFVQHSCPNSIATSSAAQLDLILFMDIRALLAGLRGKLRAFVRHRAAARLLRDAYPDADAARLGRCREQCAVCRDSMQVLVWHEQALKLFSRTLSERCRPPHRGALLRDAFPKRLQGGPEQCAICRDSMHV